METLRTVLLVAGGGALGTLARWWVSLAGERLLPKGFPWGTLLVNVAGCLAIGLVYALIERRFPEGASWRPLLVTGFLGAFTTFSAFSWEADGLLREGAFARAGAYLVGSVAFGLIAVRAGVAIGRAVG